MAITKLKPEHKSKITSTLSQMSVLDFRPFSTCIGVGFRLYSQNLIDLAARIGKKKYPRLAALAKYYLSIPASSAFSERCFSFAGNTRSIKRTGISDSKLEMMAVLKTIDSDLWNIVENDHYGDYNQ